MKFNKDSKLMKISASAEGYYSGSTAYGEIFIPYEIYLKSKENLENNLSVYVGELDGKHSEVECDIEFEEWTFSEILKTQNESYECDRDIDESVFFRICDTLDLSETQSDELNNFNNKLWELDKFYEYENITIVLKNDTKIEDVIIPKGTKIEFMQNSENKVPENWEFEYEIDLQI